MHDSLARLLKFAHTATAGTARPVQTLPQLRTLLEVSPQVINAWKSRGVSKEGAIKAAAMFGCSVGDILHGVLDPYSKAPPFDGAQLRGNVAQELSPRPYMVAPILQWEHIMKASNLPSEFEVFLVDDAMAPVAPRGTRARFSTRLTAAPGDAVLVTDVTDTLYFRVYHLGLRGTWEARSINPVYPTLHSQTDSLRVVAVFTGLEARWGQLAGNRPA